MRLPPPSRTGGFSPGSSLPFETLTMASMSTDKTVFTPTIWYISSQTDRVLIRHTEVKKILDLLRTACRGQFEPIPALYRVFNRETGDWSKMGTYSRLLGQGIGSMIETKEEKDIESLFTAGGPRP